MARLFYHLELHRTPEYLSILESPPVLVLRTKSATSLSHGLDLLVKLSVVLPSLGPACGVSGTWLDAQV